MVGPKSVVFYVDMVVIKMVSNSTEKHKPPVGVIGTSAGTHDVISGDLFETDRIFARAEQIINCVLLDEPKKYALFEALDIIPKDEIEKHLTAVVMLLEDSYAREVEHFWCSKKQSLEGDVRDEYKNVRESCIQKLGALRIFIENDEGFFDPNVPLKKNKLCIEWDFVARQILWAVREPEETLGIAAVEALTKFLPLFSSVNQISALEGLVRHLKTNIERGGKDETLLATLSKNALERVMFYTTGDIPPSRPSIGEKLSELKSGGQIPRDRLTT